MRVQERFVPCGMVVFESGDRQVCRQKAELPDKAVGHPVHVGRHDQSAQSHYLRGGLFGTAPQRGVEIPGHLPCDQLPFVHPHLIAELVGTVGNPHDMGVDPRLQPGCRLRIGQESHQVCLLARGELRAVENRQPLPSPDFDDDRRLKRGVVVADGDSVQPRGQRAPHDDLGAHGQFAAR